jgi:hypothetical protein
VIPASAQEPRLSAGTGAEAPGGRHKRAQGRLRKGGGGPG